MMARAEDVERDGVSGPRLRLAGSTVALLLALPALAQDELPGQLAAKHPNGLVARYPAGLVVREVPDGFAFASTAALRRPVAFTLRLVEGSPSGPGTGTRRLDRGLLARYRIERDPAGAGDVGSGGEEHRLVAVRELPGDRHLRLDQVAQAEAPDVPDFRAGWLVLRHATAPER